MLGATTAGALVHPVVVPPRPSELSAAGKRDWKTGVDLVKTCMNTHDTATCVNHASHLTCVVLTAMHSIEDFLLRLSISGSLAMAWIKIRLLPRIGISRVHGEHLPDGYDFRRRLLYHKFPF